MDLEIKYENGQMTVHLEEFLDCRNITKVKKLLKVIRSSFTPECEDKIREYIEQETEQYEPTQKEHARYIVECKEKVKFWQKQLDTCLANRDKYKRKSDGWKYYHEFVKQYRQELREFKALLYSWQSCFDKNVRKMEFYKKVLENIT